jgi:hypothetical protein
MGTQIEHNIKTQPEHKFEHNSNGLRNRIAPPKPASTLHFATTSLLPDRETKTQNFAPPGYLLIKSIGYVTNYCFRLRNRAAGTDFGRIPIRTTSNSARSPARKHYCAT